MMKYWIVVVVVILAAHGTPGAPLVQAAESGAPLTEDELVARVFTLAKDYFRDFQQPETYVLYGARLSTRRTWTSPQEVKAGKPEPWGYGSRIADTALHCGHLLAALLDAYEARPDPMLKQNIARTFAALKLIGSLPELHPKPDKPALIGLVPRGPHPDDVTAYYDDSSMDQHTTYIISLASYARSSLASEEEKAWIRRSLEQVGRRLEKNGWSIKRADGVREAHVGFAWTGFNSNHASILLPAVYALYRGTGDPHWLETYEKFLAEKNGLRWKLLHPGPHVQINGHPIYANQNAFRIHALCRMETDSKRKTVLRGLLKQIAEMQLRRDFPGPVYRKFHSDEQWRQLRRELGWQDDNLHGCDAAWNAFRPAMLDRGSLAVLAHVRFPLGGFHMVLLSEDPDMIRRRLGEIWRMLATVDLKKISAGETNYLFVVVALHTYATCFRRPDLFADGENAPPSCDEYGKELLLAANARLGPTMDVAIAGVQVVELWPSIKRLSEFKTQGFATDVAVSGEKVMIAAGTDGLLICELSKQGALVRKGQYHAGGRAIKQVEAPPPGAYALVQAGANDLHIVDIRNPAAPKRVLNESRPGLLYGDQLMRGLAENRYACVFWHVSGLHWYDMLADPKPTYSGDTCPLRIGSCNGLAEYEGKTLATLRGGYVLLDRGERRSLAELPVRRVGGRHDLGKPTIVGHRLYAANRAAGVVTIVDIRDITQPKLIEQFETPGNPGRVLVRNGALVIPDGYSGLFVGTVEKPASP